MKQQPKVIYRMAHKKKSYGQLFIYELFGSIIIVVATFAAVVGIILVFGGG